MDKFPGRGNHSGSRDGNPQETITKLSSIPNRKCPNPAQPKSCRLKAPSILKTTVPKPFKFQTEERSILKASNAERSPKQGKVKDGDLIRKKEKKNMKTIPTITQPFRFRTEERSFLRAAQAGQTRQLKEKELVVQKQEMTHDEKLSTRIAKGWQIEPDNCVVEKGGTEDDEVKKAAIAASEETDEKAEMAAANKVSLAMVDRVDSMLQKLENETNDGDTEIGDWWKTLDRGYGGKVPPEEVAAEAMYFKDTPGKKDGKILVGDVKVGTQTPDSEVVKLPLKGSLLSIEGAKNMKERNISTVPSLPELESGSRLGCGQCGRVLLAREKSEHIVRDSKHLIGDLNGGGNDLQMCWDPDPTQYYFPRPDLGLFPLGLHNEDNCCYLNSILQVLSFTPPLAQMFLTRSHSSICPIVRGECGICLLESHVYLAHTSFGELDCPLDPLEILIYVCKFAGNFVLGRQEDAHELLVGFIGACVSSLERLQPVKSPTVFHNIFGGSFLQQVKCRTCKTKSKTTQPFLDISLDIIHSFSLTQSLQSYFQSELLTGANKYKCNKCKKFCIADKRMYFFETPNVLAIHLKRFDVLLGRKINKHISFGESLDLSSFMKRRSLRQANHQPVYQLYGVVVHSSSSPDSGHYYAYIKDSAGSWFCCNDSDVSPCTLETVLWEKAYVLFYSRTNQSRN